MPTDCSPDRTCSVLHLWKDGRTAGGRRVRWRCGHLGRRGAAARGRPTGPSAVAGGRRGTLCKRAGAVAANGDEATVMQQTIEHDRRVPHRSRPLGRLATTWNNMSAPGAFAAAGAEEQQAHLRQ